MEGRTPMVICSPVKGITLVETGSEALYLNERPNLNGNWGAKPYTSMKGIILMGTGRGRSPILKAIWDLESGITLEKWMNWGEAPYSKQSGI